LNESQVHTLISCLLFVRSLKFWITNIHSIKIFIVLSCHTVYIITCIVTRG
jgi:hypothetical protein